jgi:L-2-hydroxyglutarate oxidase LhgO
MPKNTEVKQRMPSTREEIRKATWCYMHCIKNCTVYYKKLCEVRLQRNPDLRINTDAKKLINHKNYTMQNKKITQLETEEIKKEL